MFDVVFCLMGPTASGKTALTFELLSRFPFEIISVDSAMIYREMNIGTAKPDADELRTTPHHLIDILDPPESYCAAQFCDDANRLIQDIRSRGKLPLLTGGTMMYFRALQEGMAILPQADEALREKLLLRAEQEGWNTLYEVLRQVDPATAFKVHGHDTQRIQRALEVYYTTGTPMSLLLAAQNKKQTLRFVNLALFPENRAWLHQRIQMRFDRMLELGFLDEVRVLLDKWELPLNCPAMRCVGYRQAKIYLEEGGDFNEFREKGIAATRQLAKRQLTWLRHWPDIQLFDAANSGHIKELINYIDDWLDPN